MNLFSRAVFLALAFACTARAGEGEFDPVGEFVIRSQTKITGAGKAVQAELGRTQGADQLSRRQAFERQTHTVGSRRAA